MFPIMARVIDLSIGSILALAGMLLFDAVLVFELPGWIEIILAIGAPTLAGTLNGLFIVFFGLQPFVATLAGYRGLVYAISGRQLFPEKEFFGFSAAYCDGFVMCHLHKIRACCPIRQQPYRHFTPSCVDQHYGHFHDLRDHDWDIDLSVGPVMALSGLAAYSVYSGTDLHIAFAILFGLSVGVVVGAINGFAIAALGLPPIIVTLGMLSIIRGFALLMGGPDLHQVREEPFYTFLGSGRNLELPVSVWMFFDLAALMYWVEKRTSCGLMVSSMSEWAQRVKSGRKS